VLLVAPLPPPAGGIATWTNILLREIQHHPGVTIKHIDVALRWIKRENRSRVLRMAGGSLQALRDIVRVVIAMATFRPHILHLTTSAGYASLKDAVMMGLARIFRVAGLIHYRVSLLAHSQYTPAWQLRTALLAMRFASVVVVLDQATFAFLQQRLPPKKVNKIPNMIDLDQINRLISNGAKLTSEGVQREEVRLVFVGLVVSEKGIVEQVEACAQLENVQLHIVGPVTGAFRQQLEQRAQRRDGGQWLYFHGHVDHEEACRQILLSHIFLLPSYDEGFPNALLEGMAMAKPVVVSDVGAMAEMIDASGENPCGVCVKPRSIESLQVGLQRLLAMPEAWQAIGQSGRHRVETLYSTAPVINQLVDLWVDMHGTRRRQNRLRTSR
jgi:glycosyltransferase involved in cell wall biosynthesis